MLEKASQMVVEYCTMTSIVCISADSYCHWLRLCIVNKKKEKENEVYES